MNAAECLEICYKFFLHIHSSKCDNTQVPQYVCENFKTFFTDWKKYKIAIFFKLDHVLDIYSINNYIINHFKPYVNLHNTFYCLFITKSHRIL